MTQLNQCLHMFKHSQAVHSSFFSAKWSNVSVSYITVTRSCFQLFSCSVVGPESGLIINSRSKKSVQGQTKQWKSKSENRKMLFPWIILSKIRHPSFYQYFILCLLTFCPFATHHPACRKLSLCKTKKEVLALNVCTNGQYLYWSSRKKEL